MKYIIIDLEWNGNQTANGFFNEIIEIGGVALNDNFQITDTFQSFVKPKVTKKIRMRIKDLTHITNEDLKNADGFLSAFEKLKKWIGKGDNCLLSWGNSDILVLYENLKYYNILDDIYVIKNFCDAQLLCQMAMKIPLTKQVSLSSFAEMLAIDVGDVQLHRALNDSEVTAKCFAKLVTPELYKELAKKTDAEFYERINFKSYNITDPNDEQIMQSKYMVKCPDCEVYMKRLSRFSNRNKKHYAKYRCGCCGKKCNVSHVFKMTYDGIVHRCNLTEINASVDSTPDSTIET